MQILLLWLQPDWLSVKAGLLQKELGEDGDFIVNVIKERLHREYPFPLEPKPAHNALERQSNLEARMLQRLQPKREPQSDIDRYFKSETIDVTGVVSIYLSIRTHGDLSLPLFSFLFLFFFVGNRNREGHDLHDAVFGRVSNIM
ncbi:hypothetical protein V1527DRAFT_21726 [Lipomyces starkeyi]